MISTTNFRNEPASTRDRVGAAIQKASARTGVDFSYLMGQAKVESGLDPNARAKTSSATGLFQFIEQTWLGTVKKHGAAHGLGWAANAISQGSDGRFRVADGGTRRAILDMRKDPGAASAMAAEFASDNQAHLETRLDRPVEPVDLYLAHFLGAGGATQFLSAHESSPNAAAAGLLPDAARANRGVFYERNGSARSFAEIRDRFAAKLGGEAVSPLPRRDGGGLEFTPLRMVSLESGAAAAAPVKAVQPLPSPQHARLAYLMLAELGA